VLRNGLFTPMFVPVNPDRSFSGINLAESFGNAYQQETGIRTGLIPCAEGASSLYKWREGGELFDHACYMTELAMRNSELKAILWHQGEQDCENGQYLTYAERLYETLTALRRRIGMPEVPILIGELGEFLAKCTVSEDIKNYVYVNEALEKVAKELPNCAFVSAKGLTSNPDFVHFNSASLREFGLRYYEAYKKLVPIVPKAE